jgi:hypothetical protein
VRRTRPLDDAVGAASGPPSASNTQTMNDHWPDRDIEDLLGVYAVDGLDADERAVVDAHLARCPRCAAEVAWHRNVAALLTAGGPPPPGVWKRIAAALEEPPPPLRLVPITAPRARSRREQILASMVAVAAAAVGVVGLGLHGQDRRLDRMETAMAADGLRRSAVAALRDPAARTFTLGSAERPPVAQAALLADGRGYLVADQLPPLPADRTYQLWVLVDHQRISAGLLGRRPTVAVFHAGQRLDGLAITEEEAGGVVVSRNAPVIFGRLRSN